MGEGRMEGKVGWKEGQRSLWAVALKLSGIRKPSAMDSFPTKCACVPINPKVH